MHPDGATFDFQPVLHGELFETRPLRPDDRDALFAAASDPLIWEQHPDDRFLPDRFQAYFDARIASGGALLVTDPRTGEVIGSTSLYHLDEAASEVEIGWTFLVRSRWGGPTNLQLKGALLEHAFRSVDHVVFQIDVGNLRSQHAVRKLGAVRVEPRSRPDDASPMECFVVSRG